MLCLPMAFCGSPVAHPLSEANMDVQPSHHRHDAVFLLIPWLPIGKSPYWPWMCCSSVGLLSFCKTNRTSGGGEGFLCFVFFLLFRRVLKPDLQVALRTSDYSISMEVHSSISLTCTCYCGPLKLRFKFGKPILEALI